MRSLVVIGPLPHHREDLGSELVVYQPFCCPDLGAATAAARRAAVMRRAPGTAPSRARALLWHSRSSCSGTESATTPAPAWTDARPAGSTSSVRMAMAVSMLPEKSR